MRLNIFSVTPNFQKFYGKKNMNLWSAVLKYQQLFFKKVKAEQEAATASFRMAKSKVKHAKPFITHSALIKDCMIAEEEEICSEKVNLFKIISLCQ